MTKKILMGGKPAPSDFDRLVEAELQRKLGAQSEAQDALALARRRLAQRRADLMPAQLAFLEDLSKKKAAICTRRAGKTFVCRHLVAEAVLANSWDNRDKAQPIVQYIALTRQRCIDLFWTPFKEICRKIGLEAHWDDHSLRAQFPNGVLVRAGGCEDKDELEKYLGDAYVLVIVDEAASLGPRIEELVTKSLEPALMDYKGTMALVGTPGNAQAGLFWEIYDGQHAHKWTQHRWSYMTNIHIDAELRTPEWVEANIGPLDSPKVQREYFGVWVSDSSSLVYQYNPVKSHWDGLLPKGHEWRFILGLDVGYRDPTAFVVGAYSKTHPDFFVVHTESHSHLLPTQIYEKITTLKGQFAITRIVMDTGGSMARNNMEEWNRRGGLGIMPAEKTKKLDYIEHMNSEFHLGRIKVQPTTPVVKEWKQLVWEDDDAAVARHDNKPKEHPGFHNHMSDACLYAFRESLHYRSKSPEPEPVPGTADWFRKQQLDAKVKAMQNAGRKGFNYGKLWN